MIMGSIREKKQINEKKFSEPGYQKVVIEPPVNNQIRNKKIVIWLFLTVKEHNLIAHLSKRLKPEISRILKSQQNSDKDKTLWVVFSEKSGQI